MSQAKVDNQPWVFPYPEVVFQDGMIKKLKKLQTLFCHSLSSGGFISYPPTFFFLTLLQFPLSGILCDHQLTNKVSEELVLTLENVLSPQHTNTVQKCHN